MRKQLDGDVVPVHLSALGVPVVVRASGSRAHELGKALEIAWEWCPPDPSVRHSVSDPVVVEAFLDNDEDALTSARGRGFLASSSLLELMHSITPTVTTEAITRRAGTLLMVHACALADPVTGAAVVLVGPSGIGKTTVARTLGTSFGYLTDETAAIRPDNTILAYPKPLSVLNDAGGVTKDQVSPAGLGLLPPPAMARVAAVLMLDRSEGAPAMPAVEAVRTVHAIAALSPQVSFLGRMPTPLHRIVGLLDGGGGLRRVAYREASDLAPLVRELMGAAK